MATEFINGQWRIPNSWNVDESNQNKISNYSMGFNGTSDSVNVGLIKPFNNDVSNFAISYWIKADFIASLIHFDFRYNGATRGLAIESNSVSVVFYTAGGLGYATYWSTPISGLNNNEWNHIVLNFNGSIATDADKAEFWINGSKKTSTVTNPGNTYVKAVNGDCFLGNGFNPYPLEGQLDQFCTFDCTLSSSQIPTLYGNNSAGYFQIGNPMALTPNPVVFYPLGDQDVQQTVDSTGWRIPNQVAYGGDVFQSVPLRTTNSVPTDTITSNINYTGAPATPSPFTVSFWMKDSVVGQNSVFFDHDASTYVSTTPKGAFVYYASGRVLIYLAASFWRYYSLPAGVALTDSEWRNIVVYMDPNSISLGKVWIDGTPLALSTGNPGGGGPNDFTAGFRFYLNNFGSNVMYFKDYEIDNAGATLLYNNGAPLLDTSTLAQAPDHWWKLNASDTFDIATSTWTINDHIGSENGTSVNMDASNLVSSELLNTGGRQGYSPWAIELNGTDQNFVVDNSSEDLNVENVSLSAWFFQDDTAANSSFPAIIINGFSGSGGSYWGLVMRPGNIVRAQLKLIDSNGNEAFVAQDITETITTGQWNHIAMTYDGTTLKGYINGVEETLSLVTSAPGVTPIVTSSGPIIYSVPGMNSQDLLIGKRGTDSFRLDGKISNFAIWGSGLTSTQIATIYNNGIPGDISSLNPLAWWELGVMTGFNSATGTWTAISNSDSNFTAVSTTNMIEGDLVNGPGYSSNATGTSTLVLEKQAPYSFNNALSENMAISNRDDSQITDPYPLILELDLSDENSSYDFITPIMSSGATYPFTVDWGDGSVETILNSTFFLTAPNAGRLSHTYDTDTYPRPVVQVGKSDDVGQVVDFRVSNGGSKLQLFDIKQFGQATFLNWNTYNAQKMLITASDNLKFGGTTLAGAFQFSYKANPSTINSWDISSVKIANSLFYNTQTFNQDLNNWDTSSTRPGESEPGITQLTALTFTYDSLFNGDVSNWFTSKSTSMNQMFSTNLVFNQDISTKYISAANSPTGSAYVAWDTKNHTDFRSAFFNARAFNQDISNWDTSNATLMSTMFSGAYAFNQDISTKQVTVNGVTYTAWDVSNVTNMFGMLNSTAFDNTLDNWELSANLTNVQQMFIGNNTISDENFSDNWAIFANSVKDDNSGSGGAASGFPKGVNATAQNNNALIKVNRSAPTSTGGVQHFTTIGRALSYLTSDVQITTADPSLPSKSLQLYTADFLDTTNSSYPTKLVGVSFPDFTFEWSGTVWEFKKSGTTLDADTGGATLQQGPEDGTWGLLTVVTANKDWNFSNSGTVYSS